MGCKTASTHAIKTSRGTSRDGVETSDLMLYRYMRGPSTTRLKTRITPGHFKGSMRGEDNKTTPIHGYWVGKRFTYQKGRCGLNYKINSTMSSRPRLEDEKVGDLR